MEACEQCPDEPLSPEDFPSSVLLDFLLNFFLFLNTFLLTLVCLLALGVTFLLVVMWYYLHQESAYVASAPAIPVLAAPQSPQRGGKLDGSSPH